MVVMTTSRSVTMFFDVSCPFAWVTSRWLKEVQKVRDVDVTWAPMSLSLLNEGRDLPEDYMRMMIAAKAPALVSAAVYTHHPDLVDAFYTEMGTRIHDGEGIDKQDPHGYDELLHTTLAHIGADPALYDAAHKTADEPGSFEQQLRASHDKALELVGNEVGTPVLRLGDRAFFGPVLTRIPTGEVAGELFDASVVLGSYPHFFELKRSRTEGPKAQFAAEG